MASWSIPSTQLIEQDKTQACIINKSAKGINTSWKYMVAAIRILLKAALLGSRRKSYSGQMLAAYSL